MTDENNKAPENSNDTDNANVSEKSKDKTCEKCEEYLAGWKRALADYDNLKKDLVKERAVINDVVKVSLAHELIIVIDHFDQAAKYRPENQTAEINNWLTGILHVGSQMKRVLTDMGFESFGQKGDMFDARIHESNGLRTDVDFVENQVIDVLQSGWRLGERIVRPAKVIINSLPH